MFAIEFHSPFAETGIRKPQTPRGFDVWYLQLKIKTVIPYRSGVWAYGRSLRMCFTRWLMKWVDRGIVA